jgi:hypothetical protein
MSESKKIKATWTVESDNPFADARAWPDLEPMEYTGKPCRCGHPTPNREVPEEMEHAKKVRQNYNHKVLTESSNEFRKEMDRIILEEIDKAIRKELLNNGNIFNNEST